MLRNKLFVTMLMLATLMFSVVACESDYETVEVIKEVPVPGEGGYVGLPQSMYDDGLAAIAKYK